MSLTCSSLKKQKLEIWCILLWESLWWKNHLPRIPRFGPTFKKWINECFFKFKVKIKWCRHRFKIVLQFNLGFDELNTLCPDCTGYIHVRPQEHLPVTLSKNIEPNEVRIPVASSLFLKYSSHIWQKFHSGRKY